MQTAYLILQNNMIFEGKSFGEVKETTGEIVFTTSMTGYLETLTDPSYYGQIVVQTFPLIGNYGIIPSDFESNLPHVKAYIVRNWCQEPSNFRNEGNLDAFLKSNHITGLYDIDTRQLTKIIREAGVMNGKIIYSKENLEKHLKEIEGYKIIDAVSNVTSKCVDNKKPENQKYKVVLWDFGAKENISRELINRGCEVITVPSYTKAQEILKYDPDGVMLSNGPGDPAENKEVIAQIAKLFESKIPIFGICLGHQLMALSQGAKTLKLKYGHRGANQPAKNLETNRVYITSQNHGYTVDSSSLPSHTKEWFVNANDGTCEGIYYKDFPAFSVQFHPEACNGPHDTAFLFDDFISILKEGK